MYQVPSTKFKFRVWALYESDTAKCANLLLFNHIAPYLGESAPLLGVICMTLVHSKAYKGVE